MSPNDAARHVGLSRATIYVAMAAGHVGYRQYGSRRLVDVPSLLRFAGELPGRDAQ